MNSRTEPGLPLAVIFDMDGVMVDSEPFHYRADTEVFATLGIHVNEEERKLFLGISAADMYDYLRNRHHLPYSREELLETDLRIRRQHLLPPHVHLPAAPGLISLLERLNTAELRLGVASSSVAGLVEPLVKNLGIAGFFSCLATGDQVKKAKPHPDVFLLAASRLAVSPAACVAIEDSPNGLKAARGAGMKTIGYAPGHQMLEPAHRLIDHFDAITIDLLRDLFRQPSPA